MIRLNAVTLGYGNRVALFNITGTFATQAMTAVVGPNGGGKSTLIKSLVGGLKPKKGFIEYQGIKKKNIAYLPQRNDLDRSFPLSVRDVAAMGLLQQIGAVKEYTLDMREKVDTVLEKVGLFRKRHDLIHALSGGQFQRLIFARMMLQDAQCLILDEPFSGIDSHTSNTLMGYIQEWHAQGKTIICVLHNLSLVRQYFPCTVMLDKECQGWGKTEEVLRKGVYDAI